MSDETVSDFLRALRVTGGLIGHFSVARGACLPAPEVRGASTHVVLGGEARFHLTNGVEIEVSRGDVIVLPKPACQIQSVEVLSAEDRGQPNVIFDTWPLLQGEPEGHPDAPGVRVLCGHISVAGDMLELFCDLLPPVLRLRAQSSSRAAWFLQSLRVFEHERHLPGHSVVIDRLLEVVFIEALRIHLTSHAGDAEGLAAAFTDERIGRALLCMHRDPGAPWTIDLLARESAMSTTAFAHRFRALLGDTPVRYLTRWRMLRAAELLRTESLTIPEVAERVGYRSQATFAKTFKRWVREPPGAYRSRSRAGQGRPLSVASS